MKDKKDEASWGVVCIHCRLQTPVAKSTQASVQEKKSSQRGTQISIVRCAKCGGEAPYLMNELVAINIAPGPKMWPPEPERAVRLQRLSKISCALSFRAQRGISPWFFFCTEIEERFLAALGMTERYGLLSCAQVNRENGTLVLTIISDTDAPPAWRRRDRLARPA